MMTTSAARSLIPSLRALALAAAALWVTGASAEAWAQATNYQSRSGTGSSARSFRSQTGSRGSVGRSSFGGSSAGRSSGGGTTAAFSGRGSTSSINLNAIAPGETLYRWYDGDGNVNYGTYDQAPEGTILAGPPGVDMRQKLLEEFYGEVGPPKPVIHVEVDEQALAEAAAREAGAAPPSTSPHGPKAKAGPAEPAVESAPDAPATDGETAP